jgi:5-methylcytosine-specific restriction endonuclease McrA
MSSSKFIKHLAGYRCQICGDEDGKSYESGVRVELQAHHIVPRSQGGQRKIENLVALCDFCHNGLIQQSNIIMEVV